MGAGVAAVGPCECAPPTCDGVGVDLDGDWCADTCGLGACGPDDACGPAQRCVRPMGACGAGPGQCVGLPDLCTHPTGHMCGCDGQSYGNVCAAWASQADVAYFGPCE